ncbi:redoxin domain-containing protein [Halogranum rubrum]|uniref:thioredoxin-dependent peroxiredoxin n=1 Tax=Halogranum salarium B-1 TaxID=1210908 RepID=J3A5Y4_9EURY|nr:redoxin domain-containing protein [Halogranum salarium]EJN60893.1 peroxiredoxin [Halogranum salarium B-1]
MDSSTGLAVGEVAPDFTAPLVRADGETERIALSALLEDRPVLLSFYTADFSPDCVSEWCSFRDFDWFSTNETVQVVGISRSSVGLHRRFINHLNLGFPLYADPDLDVAEAFGVDYRAFGLSRRARRSCFLIDRDRTIRYRWLSEHWLDPTRDTPPVGEIHDAIRREFGVEETDSFGF